MTVDNSKPTARRIAFEREAKIIGAAKESRDAALRARALQLGIAVGELTLDQKGPIWTAYPLPSYETLIIPPRGAEPDPNIPLHLSWTNGSREYDVYMDDQQPPSEEAVEMLWQELHEDGIDENRRWAVIDRGEGRLNILPPLQVPRHEHVAQVVARVLGSGHL